MSSDSDAARMPVKYPVYQLWYEEELRWIDIPLLKDEQLEHFLLSWTEKRPGMFRRIWRLPSYRKGSIEEQVWAEMGGVLYPERHEDS